MSLFALILFFLGCSVCVEAQSKDKLAAADHYWRDYEGEIPEDAFKAGKDSVGNIIYIGQVSHEGRVIPGQIKQSKKKVSYDYSHREYSTGINVKILCVRHPEQYIWSKTSTVKFDKLDKSLLVVGGFRKTDSSKTYIGRVTSEEETSVGKVVNIHGKRELHITKHGVAVDYKTFEILSFNPKAPEITTNSYLITTASKTWDGDLLGQFESDSECAQHIINITIY